MLSKASICSVFNPISESFFFDDSKITFVVPTRVPNAAAVTISLSNVPKLERL